MQSWSNSNRRTDHPHANAGGRTRHDWRTALLETAHPKVLATRPTIRNAPSLGVGRGLRQQIEGRQSLLRDSPQHVRYSPPRLAGQGGRCGSRKLSRSVRPTSLCMDALLDQRGAVGCSTLATLASPRHRSRTNDSGRRYSGKPNDVRGGTRRICRVLRHARDPWHFLWRLRRQPWRHRAWRCASRYWLVAGSNVPSQVAGFCPMPIIAIGFFVWGFYTPIWPNGVVGAMVFSVLSILASWQRYVDDRATWLSNMYLAAFTTCFDFAFSIGPMALARAISGWLH